MDLSDLIERNAAFTPDKPAIVFEGEDPELCGVQRTHRADGAALKAEFGVGRGDRVAILSLNRPDYLVLLYACARLGAILVPLNWRLAVAEQLFILSDASAKVLVLEQAFADSARAGKAACPTRHRGARFFASQGCASTQLLAQARGDGRNPHTDLSCPLLIVYTSGTTGRPKGAVLRQEALLWNGVMSQHMHGLTSERSRPDRAAFLSRRRTQHSDHAGAAPWRHRDDPSAIYAGRDARQRSSGIARH